MMKRLIETGPELVTKAGLIAGVAAIAMLMPGPEARAQQTNDNALYWYLELDPDPGYGYKPVVPPRPSVTDGNDDGIISEAEAGYAAEQRFARLDANDDGKVSEREFLEANEQLIQAWWRHDPAYEDLRAELEERFDGYDGADGDGLATKEEFKAHAWRVWNKADADSDGFVSVWEYADRDI